MEESLEERVQREIAKCHKELAQIGHDIRTMTFGRSDDEESERLSAGDADRLEWLLHRHDQFVSRLFTLGTL